MDVFTTGIVSPVQALKGKVKEVSFSLNLADVSSHNMEGWDYLKVADFKPSTAPGEPMLPMKTFVVTLPKNSKILGVQLITGKHIPIVNILNIVPTPEPQPISVDLEHEISKPLFTPKEKTYSMNTYFPGKFISYISGSDNEYTYVFVRVWPVQYIPNQKKAILLTDATIRVTYKLSKTSIKSHTITSESIIITPQEFYIAAVQLANFHEIDEGITTTVVNTSWILENYEESSDPPLVGYSDPFLPDWDVIQGYDYSLAKKIISFMNDIAYHPNLKYVTILGNAKKVPPSYYHYSPVTSGWDSWIPTDFFYESPDYDLVPNYMIGRLSVNSLTEAEHVVQKIKSWYLNVDWNWFKNVVVAGGTTWDTEWYCGELKTIDLANENILSGMNVTTMFQSDDKFNDESLSSALSGGYGLVYQEGHGSGSSWGLEGDPLDTTEILSLSPSSKVPIVISVACINGLFDTHIVNPGFDVSFAESLLLSNAGGIAYIGGSRINYGTRACAVLDNGMVVDVIHAYMEEILKYTAEAYHDGGDTLGNLTKTARIRFVANNGFDYILDNRTYYAYILHGDPALKIPIQQPSAGYQQPLVTSINPEPDFYDHDIPNYNLIGGTTVQLNGNTDSPEVRTKTIDVIDQETLDRKQSSTTGNDYTYSYVPDRETMYAIRTSADDTKEGWFYLNINDIIYEHDLEIINLTVPNPPYAKPSETVEINTTIKNRGLNDEIDIEVRFLVDSSIKDTHTIPTLAVGESTKSTFEWSETIEKKYNLSIYVVPVSGETSIDDNTKEKKFFINSKEPRISAVLDSHGADYPQYRCWDYLNDNWDEYGSEPIFIDYETLNKDDITYEDLTNSNADVIFISNAYRERWEFTDSEINAIKNYVGEGHGLIGTGGTLSLGWNPGDIWLPTNNNKLAPLFGMREDLEYMWPIEIKTVHYFDILDTDHPLFSDITTPLHGFSSSNVPSPDYTWDEDDLADGEYVAISQNYHGAIIVYNRSVYFTHLPGKSCSIYNMQLLYNTITWSYTSFCGDSICDKNENYTNCPQDCELSLESMNIAIDNSHGQSKVTDTGNFGLSRFYDLLTNFASVSVITDKPLTIDTLRNYDVVIFPCPYAGTFDHFSDDEINAIVDYVNEGGNILVSLHGSNAGGGLYYWPDFYNPIVERFGMTFNFDNYEGEIDDLVSHDITSKINYFYTFIACSIEPGDSEVIARVDDKPILLAKDYGHGRLVLLGSTYTYQNGMFYWYSEYEGPNMKLMFNTLNWLKTDSCEDSDGGINYLKKGTVSGYKDGVYYEYSDECGGSGWLTELYCEGTSLAWTDKYCPDLGSRYECAYGECYRRGGGGGGGDYQITPEAILDDLRQPFTIIAILISVIIVLVIVYGGLKYFVKKK